MSPRPLSVYIFVVLVVVTDAVYTRFGRIRKRKNFSLTQNSTKLQPGNDDLYMYFTRRTTPWPRLTVPVDPSIEAYYKNKDMKENSIKQAYFRKAKMKKKRRDPTIASKQKAPTLFSTLRTT